jgi:hypothetical protein
VASRVCGIIHVFSNGSLLLDYLFILSLCDSGMDVNLLSFFIEVLIFNHLDLVLISQFDPI